MKEEIGKLLDQYLMWLKDKTTLREVNDWVEITSPYLDRHNDYLQIYVKKQNGRYILTDDGFIVDDLLHSGCKLESPKRQALLKSTLAGFGVSMTEKGRLEAIASSENFALRKHSLVQAMLAINDMFFLAEPAVASLFYEDVVSWLDLNEIRYTSNTKFTGKSGYDHHFDFVIPKSKRQPERILQAVNRPERSMAENIAFRWIDTKDVRSPDAKAYAILNDQEGRVATGVVEALQSYGMSPILWSEREKAKDELAA